MAKIKNTAYPASRTRHFYDDETMSEYYDQPGITFDEDGGRVARIRQEVVDDVVAKFDSLERVADSPESAADASDASAETPAADDESDDEN